MEKNIAKIMTIIIFLLIWCAPLFNGVFSGYHFLFIAGYLAGILALVFIKNKFISFIIAIIIFMIPTVVLNREYLFFVFCPFAVTAEYIEAFKRRGKSVKENRFYLGANISIFAGAAVLIYQYFNSGGSHTAYRALQIVIWAMFIICLILAALCSSKHIPRKQMASESGLREYEIKEIRFIHISNVICYTETLLFYYFVNTNTLEYAERIFFFPWFIYFCLMVCYKDPIFDRLVKKAENLFGKVAEKSV